MNPKPNEIYKHFKGNLYKIITCAIDSEDGKEMVVYQALYGDYKVYVRPLDMFTSKVDREKYPDAPQEYRFERVDAIVGGGMTDMSEEHEPNESTTNITDSDEFPKGMEPLIMEFLDADTMAQKRNILTSLHHRITEDMINTFAMSLDFVIEEDGDLEEKYQQLRNCIAMKEKFECERQ